MESLKNLYRIGPGPSSSHTLAVQNACQFYLEQYPNYSTYVVELFGSLALTGVGHGTDKIIERSFLSKQVTIRFNKEMYKGHANTMIFYTVNGNYLTNQCIIYSTGGGAIEIEGIKNYVNKNVYPHNSFGQIAQYCQSHNINLAQYVYNFEPDIKVYLLKVMTQMLACCRSGITKEGYLPGPLHLEKVSKKIYRQYLDCEDNDIKDKLLLSAFAYGAMEENACGSIVVTAPTLGSCGIVSALVNFYYEKGVSKEILINALAAAGVIGNLVKTNASISGAVGGCQAEVGTACCMGAAFASYIEGLSIQQIEIAAEIAMEHHLGLTCDPIGGYVQVPCIERNGVAVLRSIDAMMYAKYISPLKENKVSFDKVVEVMNYTGNKIAMELKETSLGGLADIVPVKINNH